jgi:hypothetical protein
MARNQAVAGQEAIDFEARLVYEWRVTSLTGLGIPRPCSG